MTKSTLFQLALLAALLGGLSACTQVNEGSLTLVNGLKVAVEGGSVKLGSQTVAFSALTPGASSLLGFNAKGSGGAYRLELVLAGGEKHQMSIGQLQPGWVFQDQLKLEPARVSLESRQWQAGRESDPLSSSFVEKFSTFSKAEIDGRPNHQGR